MRYSLLFLLGCCFTISNGVAQITSDVQAFYSFHGNADNSLGTGVDDFQLIGTPTPTTDRFGNVDCAYEFPGDNANYLSIPTPSSNIDVNYMNGWSISLWYQGGSSEIGDLEHIFTQGSGAFICNQISVYDLNKPMVEVFDFNTTSGPLDPLYIWADDQPNLNYYMDSTMWHHVVLAVKPNDFINLYVDNVLQSESLTNQNVDDYCGSPIAVGKSFHGKIDDIVIYHKALDVQDVDTLFNFPSFCSSSPLGVSDYEAKSLVELYPNPVANVLTIESEGIAKQFTMTDVLGKAVLTGNINQEETQVDVNHLPNGIYYLTLESEPNVAHKVVVLH